MRKMFLLLFLLGLTYVSYGQNKSFDPNTSIQNISIAQWGDENGLSSNNTNSVFQDSKGLIWITSFNGFMIFDGERVEVYDLNTLPFLETNGFYLTVEDKEGTIFLGSQGSGIVRYKEDKFEPFITSGDKITKSIGAIYFSKNGVIYVGCYNNGIYKIKDGVASKLDDKLIDRVSPRVITEGEDGTIWIGTESNGLFGIKGDRIVHFMTSNGLISNDVLSLEILRNGDLLIGTARGLQSLSMNGDFMSIALMQNVYINCMMIDEWNSIWIGSEDGLARLDSTMSSVEWIRSKRGIDLVRISSIIQDKEGNIWLSSSRSGIIRIKESEVSNLTTPYISGNRVYTVHESWNGKLYIGTDQNQIDICEGIDCDVLVVNTDLGGNGVRNIYHDKDGSLWLATYAGIIHIEHGKESVYSTQNGMPADNFRTILKDSKGYFWFGSRSGGLVKWKNGKILEKFNKGNGLESSFILSVEESESGDIYVGTHSGGLTIIDTGGLCRTYHVKDDDSGILLFNIEPESPDNAKIMANTGPIHFDGDTLKFVNLRSDHVSKAFFDMVVDEEGHIWITTDIGVMMLKEEHWHQFVRGEIRDIPYYILNENNGMNSRECTGATKSTILSNGKVYVPTLGGVCIIDPKDVSRSNTISDVIIRHIEVDGKELDLSESENEIAAGSIRYTFHYSLMSYISPDANQFRYKLEGFDQNWSPVTYSGAVEYTNLPPGKYKFRVIGSNNGITWNQRGDSNAFKVLPFFYETIWFYLLIIVVVMVLFFLLYSWRISFINRQNIKLKKINTELDRLVYSASHEMRSPLSSILGLINIARIQMNKEADANEYLTYIETSVHKLDSFISDIIDYSKNSRQDIEINQIDLKPLVKTILSDISFTENYSGVKCTIVKCTIVNEYKDSFYSDEKRLKIVLSNIITNAFKHHDPDNKDEAFVRILIKGSDRRVKIEIKDNGPGIPKKHQKDIFKMFYRATNKTQGSGLGLYIVEEIINKLEGTVKVISKRNKGTKFVIELPNLIDSPRLGNISSRNSGD